MKNLLSLILLFSFCLSYGQLTPRTKEFNTSKNLAVEGYDVVSYFNKSPKKGSKKYAVRSQGVLYYFSSQKNKQLFLSNSRKYKPMYGGWCAYAMGKTGDKVSVDVKTFKIIDGKLYLFYNAFFNNTLTTWNKDQANLKKKADANWAKILKGK